MATLFFNLLIGSLFLIAILSSLILIIKRNKIEKLIAKVKMDTSNSIDRNKNLINANILCDQNWKITKLSIFCWIMLVIILISCSIPSIFSYLLKINWKNMTQSLLFNFITFIAGIAGSSVIVAIINAHQNKKIELQKQYNWRKQLYEIEQKNIDSYTINDLFLMNCFINPYSHKSAASHFVNELLYNIYMDRPEIVDICRLQLDNMLKHGFMYIEASSYHSLLTLSEENINSKNINERLSRREALDIKLCCHVLAKAKWEDKL